MALTRPTTMHMGISDARAKLTSVVNDVRRGDTRIVVERSGIPVAVVVSPDDFAELQRLHRARGGAPAGAVELGARFAGVADEDLAERALELAAEVLEQRRVVAARDQAKKDAWRRVDEIRRNFVDTPPDELWDRAVSDIDALRAKRRADPATSTSVGADGP